MTTLLPVEKTPLLTNHFCLTNGGIPIVALQPSTSHLRDHLNRSYANHTRMKFTVTPGGANILNDYWAEYTEIETASMAFNFSDDGINYTATYSFTDD